jgi:ribosomal protein S18 acetylase RimI-like enzyme
MHALDNVCYKALTTRQAGFAESFDQARRFVHDVSVIGAFLQPTPRGYESLGALVKEGENVNLALESPYEPRDGWSLVRDCPMLQMVYQGNCTDLSLPSDAGERVVELGSADVPEMMELTALTKPGPFSKRTHELGAYVGIRLDGRLIAMAGERMKVPGYTEVSAVCTHPEHTGKGYARALMTTVMRQICERGEKPFLHVREPNVHAVQLYERMGFVKRVLLHLAVLRKNATRR